MIDEKQKSYVRVEDVHIKRERLRSEEKLGDIEGLATSLLRFGQLQPIILERDNSLVAGRRRLAAHQLNCAEVIWFVYQDEIDELTAREIELEENLQREQMTWQDKAKGLAELDRIKRLRDPNWGQTQTAEAAGGNTSQRDVSQAIQISKMMQLFPEIGEAKSLSQAVSWSKQKASNVMRTMEVRDNVADFADIEAKISLGDSVDWIRTLDAESVHHIVTDPPFGIDAQARKEGTEGTLTSYQDDKDSYRRLLSMAPDLYRVLKPNGFCIWFFGISWYEEVKRAFSDAGFTVDEIPIMWNRSDGRTHTNRPDRYFGRGYDVAIHAFKGEPQLVQRGKSNVLSIPPVPNEDRVTLFERPVDLYAELIRRISIPGEIILDAFVGGGGCPAAAASLGRDYIGCELDPERRAYALTKIKAYTPDKK